MENYLKKLQDLFCYCGLSKEEYRAIKKDAYISNFMVWKHLHVLLFIGYIVLTMLFFSFNGLTTFYGREPDSFAFLGKQTPHICCSQRSISPV